MARIGESADLLKCSFCGKSQKQVQQLIAGPGVYICDECVELCNEIIEERLAEAGEEATSEFDLPKPKEIFSFLEEYVIGQEPAKRALSVAPSIGETAAAHVSRTPRTDFEGNGLSKDEKEAYVKLGEETTAS